MFFNSWFLVLLMPMLCQLFKNETLNLKKQLKPLFYNNLKIEVLLVVFAGSLTE